VTLVHWSIFAVADGIGTIRFDSHTYQHFTQGERAALPERTIVFFRASFVTVAFNFDRIRRVCFQVSGYIRDLDFSSGLITELSNAKCTVSDLKISAFSGQPGCPAP
jgi:hypothetical protein